MQNNDLDWLIITIVVIIFCVIEIVVAVKWDPTL